MERFKSARGAAVVGLAALLIILLALAVVDFGTNALHAKAEGTRAPAARPSVAPPPMVPVPASDFLMGSRGDAMASDDEKPQHEVYLDAFRIDKYEVTNALYQQCVDAGPCDAPSGSFSSAPDTFYDSPALDNYPVVNVTWYDAAAYCKWVGQQLPTEAQWEKAARGTDGRIYPWGNQWDATKLSTSLSSSHPGEAAVGSYPSGASPYGAMDMAGNVWEWVADWYDPNYYAHSPSHNPQGPASGLYKVIRGGSWDDGMADARAANRDRADPTYPYGHLGFRCAKGF